MRRKGYFLTEVLVSAVIFTLAAGILSLSISIAWRMPEKKEETSGEEILAELSLVLSEEMEPVTGTGYLHNTGNEWTVRVK